MDRREMILEQLLDALTEAIQMKHETLEREVMGVELEGAPSVEQAEEAIAEYRKQIVGVFTDMAYDAERNRERVLLLDQRVSQALVAIEIAQRHLRS